MVSMDASGSRLCRIVQDAGLRPRTVQHFQTVLATAGVIALVDAGVIALVDAGVIALVDTGFASRMRQMMVDSIRRFTAIKKRVDNLAILLQPACPGTLLPATLIGLQGDELFQALVALQLPEVATKNVHLEAALAAHRLAMQETVDLHIHEIGRASCRERV